MPCNILENNVFNKRDVLKASSDSDFKFIYEALMPVIYKVSYNIVGEEETAEDICHDSLIKMSEKKNGISVNR